MTTVLQTRQHPKQSEINYLEEAQFEAHLLFRTIQNMLIEHGETKDGVNLEQDAKYILGKIRKLIKKTKAMDS